MDDETEYTRHGAAGGEPSRSTIDYGALYDAVNDTATAELLDYVTRHTIDEQAGGEPDADSIADRSAAPPATDGDRCYPLRPDEAPGDDAQTLTVALDRLVTDAQTPALFDRPVRALTARDIRLRLERVARAGGGTLYRSPDDAERWWFDLYPRAVAALRYDDRDAYIAANERE